MQVSRSDRVGEEVKHAVSEILREELKDPGITSMVSVVRAEVTRDFRYAKIHVSLYGSETQQEETLAALKRAAGFVRRELGACTIPRRCSSSRTATSSMGPTCPS